MRNVVRLLSAPSRRLVHGLWVRDDRGSWRYRTTDQALSPEMKIKVPAQRTVRVGNQDILAALAGAPSAHTIHQI